MPDAESQIRFGLLGPVSAVHAGTAVEISASRQRILLAALLLRANQTVDTEELAEQVWDGEPPTGATTTLRSYMMRLRRTLGPVVGARLRTRAPGYLVDLHEDAELDLLLFNALRRRGQDAAVRLDWNGAAVDLQASLGLWRGSALEDVPAGLLKDREIPSLQEGLIQAHELLARAELELGRPGEALERVLRLQESHPYREQLSCLLMRAQSAAGRPTEALDEFTRLRRSLVDELGVEPGQHSRELQAAILAGEPLPPWPMDAPSAAPVRGPERGPEPAAASPAAPPPTVPAQLPSGLLDFTGRDSQVEYLSDALTAAPLLQDAGGAGTTAVCLISGAGGVGKTTLAVQVAHRLAAGFPDGQLFLNLRGSGSRPLAPADALSSFLRALGVPDSAIPRDEQEREALYRSHLATRRVLVLLDDVRDAAQLRPLLPASAGCGVLATSRSRCASLSVAARTELGAMARHEAELLFTAIVGTERSWGQEDSRTRILDCCDQHPLAVRIAAARLVARPEWSFASLADRLAERRSRLRELVVDDLGVRVSFGLSYDTLVGSESATDREAARIFRLLGMWQGGEIVLAAVAAMADRSPEQTRAALARLVDIHFVREPERDRYAMHDLLHLFARELAAEPEPGPGSGPSGPAGTGPFGPLPTGSGPLGSEAGSPTGSESDLAAVGRLGAWYLHTAYRANELVKPERRRFDMTQVQVPETTLEFASNAEAQTWMDHEQSNLCAVIAQAGELRIEPVAQLLPMETLLHLLMRRELELVIETQTVSMESARRTGGEEHEACSLNGMARAHMELKQIDEALETARAALAIQTRRGDLSGQAAATESIALCYYFSGRLEEALPWFEQALPLRREAARLDPTYLFGLLATLSNTGLLYHELGRYEDAVVAFGESIPTSHQAGSMAGVGIGHLNLGESYKELNRLQEAEESLRTALATARESDDRYLEANSLVSLGDVLEAAGDPAAAALAWTEAAGRWDALGDTAAADGLRRRIAEAGALV
jgi:DNA-binding SARP family transcriptional activator